MIVGSLERGDVLIEVRPEVELCGLIDQRADQVLGQNLRVSADIEDVFLGVKRGQLTTQLRQGVDDLGGGAAHARVKRGEQPRWAAADNRDVGDLVRHL